MDMDCVKREIDLFGEPIHQTDIMEGYMVEHLPINAVTKANKIHFRIMGNNEEFVKMNSCYLLTNIKLTKVDKSKFVSTNQVFPNNNLLHSMFSNIDVSFNSKKIATDHSYYHYKSYLQTLLNFKLDDSKHLLSAALWCKDTPGEWYSHAANKGGMERLELMEKSEYSLSAELGGRLFIDFFNQDQLLLNNIDIDIELYPNIDKFTYSSTTSTKMEYEIDSIALHVRKVKLDEHTKENIMKELSIKPAVYPFTRGVVKTFNLAKNSTSMHYENVFLGTLPTRLFIGFLYTNTMSFDSTLNPFELANCDVNYVALYKNGMQIPAKPYTPQFHKSCATRSYLSLFKTTNTYYNNKSVNISLNEYKKGYTLWGFDFTPDECEDDYFNGQDIGNIKLEVRFRTALEYPTTLIVYADFDSVLRITEDRDIITDYVL